MLAGVLLHMVETPQPVDMASDRRARQQRFGCCVPHFAGLILFHPKHRHCQGSSAAGNSGQRAEIMRLSAAGGIKRSTVECDAPLGPAFATRLFADIDNFCCKGLQE